MSVFERLLKPDSIELPACRCGRELEIDRIELVPDSDERVRIYQCQSCGTELRLPESATTDTGNQTSTPVQSEMTTVALGRRFSAAKWPKIGRSARSSWEAWPRWRSFVV